MNCTPSWYTMVQRGLEMQQSFNIRATLQMWCHLDTRDKSHWHKREKSEVRSYELFLWIIWSKPFCNLTFDQSAYYQVYRSSHTAYPLQLMGTELNTKRSSLPRKIDEKYSFIHTKLKLDYFHCLACPLRYFSSLSLNPPRTYFSSSRMRHHLLYWESGFS